MNENDIKVKYLAISKRIFEHLDTHDFSTVKEVEECLQLGGQNAYRHMAKLLKDGFLSRTPNIVADKFLAINKINFKTYQDKELATYNFNQIEKHKIRKNKLTLNTLPDHIVEAIKNGIINKTSVRKCSPMVTHPEKFMGNRTYIKQSSWLGYSSFDML